MRPGTTALPDHRAPRRCARGSKEAVFAIVCLAEPNDALRALEAASRAPNPWRQWQPQVADGSGEEEPALLRRQARAQHGVEVIGVGGKAIRAFDGLQEPDGRNEIGMRIGFA